MTEKKTEAQNVPGPQDRIKELEKDLKQKETRIAELERQAEKDQKQIVELERQAGGVAGWLVTTPTKYSGSTAGVVFRNGRAFLPNTPEGEKLADFLVNEFGYSKQFVSDWQTTPEGPQITKSLIDVLMLPQQR